MYRSRARDIGIRIGDLDTGSYNNITDVSGVKVGHVTLIEGSGELVVGKGPIRTGVTAILPHEGNVFQEKVKAAAHIINGFGKSIGIIQINELGTIETPILLTNTLNVGIVADALIEYMLEQNDDIGITTGTVNPLVGECNDGYLNDIQGRHVKRKHVFDAIKAASTGLIEEGAVGAGTGMTAFDFKGGIGSSSRIIPIENKNYTLGVLALTNFGRCKDLRIDGVHIGKKLQNFIKSNNNSEGSIIVVIATDAPLSSRQLGRICRRATLGIARTGSIVGHGSGDIVIGFSTAIKIPHYSNQIIQIEKRIMDENLNPFFEATIEATEEAIVNSLLKSDTMEGRDNNTAIGIPVEQVIKIMEEHGKKPSL